MVDDEQGLRIWFSCSRLSQSVSNDESHKCEWWMEFPVFSKDYFRAIYLDFRIFKKRKNFFPKNGKSNCASLSSSNTETVNMIQHHKKHCFCASSNEWINAYFELVKFARKTELNSHWKTQSEMPFVQAVKARWQKRLIKFTNEIKLPANWNPTKRLMFALLVQSDTNTEREKIISKTDPITFSLISATLHKESKHVPPVMLMLHHSIHRVPTTEKKDKNSYAFQHASGMKNEFTLCCVRCCRDKHNMEGIN